MKDEKEKLLVEAYKDILQPSAREIGDLLRNTTKVARFVFAPLDYLSAQQDRWQKYLARVAERVKEENLVEGRPEVIGPIVEGIRYVDADSLVGELFTQLLADSVDKEKQDLVHPAFPKIVQQLSHDEAVILYFLKKQKFDIRQKWDLHGQRVENMRTEYEEFPVVKLSYPNNIWMYMDHLSSLTIAGTWKIRNDEPIFSGGSQVGGIVHSERRLTEFGILFTKACVPDQYEGL